LLKSLINYFGCGNSYLSPVREVADFFVEKFSDLNEKIISFFKKYPVLGVKSKDFADFCEASEILKNQEHLTVEGLEKI